MTVQGAALSDRGQVREINEDAVHLESPASLEARTRGVLCVLADGMGGYAAGEFASRLAVQGIRDRYYASPSRYVVDALRGAVEAANQDIWQQGRRHPEYNGMGCTVTAALIMDDNLVVGHVGDSRAYLIRGQGIAQITEDHSWVAEQVACGALTEEQAKRHPHRNVILRALGARKSVDVAVYREKVRPGDALVLCSDGLSTTVSDEEIGRIVQDYPPEQAVRRLVALANKRGAPDNVTVAVLRVLPLVQAWAARLRQWGPLIAAVAVLLALGLALGIVTSSHSGEVATEGGSAQPTVVTAPDSESGEAATPAPQGTSVPATTPAERPQAVVTENARPRPSPTIDATVLDTLQPGETVVVGRQERGDVPAGHTSSVWYEVTRESGETGFVYGEFLDFASPAAASTPSALDSRCCREAQHDE